MPKSTPKIKVDSVIRLGDGMVTVHNDKAEDYDEAKKLCEEYAEEHGLSIVPAFDDPYVIAGQGTIGIEILHKIPEPDAVFVQIGGGGLAAGISEYIKGKDNPPNTKVIGVEGKGQDAMNQNIKSEDDIVFEINSVDPFADGTAVKKPGERTYKICKARLDSDIVLVSNDEICAAIKDIYDGTSTPCSLRP